MKIVFFCLNIDRNDKYVTIMYWAPKMHKDPTGACFIVVLKKAVQNLKL